MIPGIFELLSAREVHARGSVAEPVFVFVFTFFFLWRQSCVTDAEKSGGG